MNQTDIKCLKEMRNACATCFRVIARHELAEELEEELVTSNIKEGFGFRFQQLIKKLDGKEYRQFPK